MVTFNWGVLISPLSDPELLNKMIRELNQVHRLDNEIGRARAKKDFKTFLDKLHQEEELIDDISEKSKVKTLRVINQLHNVEQNFLSYRKTVKKQLRSSQDNETLKQTLESINEFLKHIKEFKRKIQKNSHQSIIEEKKLRNAA